MTMTFTITRRRLSRTVSLSTAITALLLGSQLALAQAPDAMKAQARHLASICRSDYSRLCNGVMPGGGRVAACLAAKADGLSPACKAALPEAQALAARAGAAGVAPK